jgi:hypothetical protein
MTHCREISKVVTSRSLIHGYWHLEDHAVSIFRSEVCRDRNASVIHAGCKEAGQSNQPEVRFRPMHTVDRKMALIRATILFSLSQVLESVTVWDDPFSAPIWILTKDRKWNTEKQENVDLLRALPTEAKISPLLWGLRYRSVNSGGSNYFVLGENQPSSSFLQGVDFSFLLLTHNISNNYKQVFVSYFTSLSVSNYGASNEW